MGETPRTESRSGGEGEGADPHLGWAAWYQQQATGLVAPSPPSRTPSHGECAFVKLTPCFKLDTIFRSRKMDKVRITP